MQLHVHKGKYIHVNTVENGVKFVVKTGLPTTILICQSKLKESVKNQIIYRILHCIISFKAINSQQ